MEMEDLRRKIYDEWPAVLIVTLGGAIARCARPNLTMHYSHMMCHHLDLGSVMAVPSSGVRCGRAQSVSAKIILMTKHSGSETIHFDKVRALAWTSNTGFLETGAPA